MSAKTQLTRVAEWPVIKNITLAGLFRCLDRHTYLFETPPVWPDFCWVCCPHREPFVTHICPSFNIYFILLPNTFVGNSSCAAGIHVDMLATPRALSATNWNSQILSWRTLSFQPPLLFQVGKKFLHFHLTSLHLEVMNSFFLSAFLSGTGD